MGNGVAEIERIKNSAFSPYPRPKLQQTVKHGSLSFLIYFLLIPLSCREAAEKPDLTSTPSLQIQSVSFRFVSRDPIRLMVKVSVRNFRVRIPACTLLRSATFLVTNFIPRLFYSPRRNPLLISIIPVNGKRGCAVFVSVPVERGFGFGTCCVNDWKCLQNNG